MHVAARFSGHDVATFIDGKRVANVDGSRRPGSREEFTVSFFALDPPPGNYGAAKKRATQAAVEAVKG